MTKGPKLGPPVERDHRSDKSVPLGTVEVCCYTAACFA
jgi:hypothetical protein